ncbi:MAG: phenylalanine--tRNA ligase subunit beta [Gammaproteobacteria bacterium]|nr:phenylalanine--tRNA ligase subunit beta [Gammaproteobacteria bacterium]MCF6362975.1 phenylalanine--tRNA ligase subunit beta [Gammaproteobacteria bacterium]
MKFSEYWLREWVNPDIGSDELAQLLTLAGLEVEAVEPVAGEFTNTIVGQVTAIAAHPDADKLNVCAVDVGQDEPLQIVCGASNVVVGMKAAVALVGARLPGGMKIKEAKLRGVPSFGMLCSEAELGLAESADGLMALPADAPVGTDIRQYLHLDDNTFELGLTPNRGDCLSIAGVAREVGVVARTEVTAKLVSAIEAAVETTFPLQVEAGKDCPRYVGRVIEGIDPAAVTPLWMQEALRRSGLRSLGPVVDVTNFVLLELGQPMHAFDLDRLDGGLSVRHATAGEKITLLDGQEIALEVGTLVIADGRGAQALAGIMGGQGSAVSDATRNIFLESAFFNPQCVAGRARGYGLHTDSSHRFERGVDPQLQRMALERATALLLKIVGGQAGPVSEVVHAEHLPQQAAILLRRQRIRRILGAEVPDTEVEDILSRLGMTLTAAEEGWDVLPPSFRFDMEIEVDLIEEIARIHGYESLPSSCPQATAIMQPQPEGRVPVTRLQQILVDRGYQEAITYSFVEPGLLKALDPHANPVRLSNPISEDMSVMRTSLWPGLVKTLAYNLNRQQSGARLFEIGLRFVRQGNELSQEKCVAGLVSGPLCPEQWGEPARSVDFYDLKGDLEALLDTTGALGDFRFVSESHPALHPGQSARILRDGQEVGWIGAIHPAIEKEIGINQRAFVFELHLSCFDQAAVPHFTPVSRYPAIRRDLALLIDRRITAAALEEVVRENADLTLKSFHLFDVYEGEGIDSGRKSIAFGLTFQDQSRTLIDSDIDRALSRILSALTDKLGATLRE